MSNQDQPPQLKSCIDCTIGTGLNCMTFSRMKSNIGAMFAHYTGDKEGVKIKAFQETAIGCPDFTIEKIQSPWV